MGSFATRATVHCACVMTVRFTPRLVNMFFVLFWLPELVSIVAFIPIMIRVQVSKLEGPPVELVVLFDSIISHVRFRVSDMFFDRGCSPDLVDCFLPVGHQHFQLSLWCLHGKPIYW
jgi:hypothetical protein